MKKFLGIIALCIFISTNLVAKEIRTRFGFYVDLPNNYMVVNDQNVGSLMNDYEGSEMDKDFFNDFVAGSSSKDLNIEYYFPKNFNAELNSINLNVQRDASFEDIEVLGLNELCPYFTGLFSELYKKNVKQYNCSISKKFRPKFNKILYLKHDGLYRNQFLIQYMVGLSNGLATFTIGCEKKHCNTLQKDTERIIFSVKD